MRMLNNFLKKFSNSKISLSQAGKFFSKILACSKNKILMLQKNLLMAFQKSNYCKKLSPTYSASLGFLVSGKTYWSRGLVCQLSSLPTLKN